MCSKFRRALLSAPLFLAFLVSAACPPCTAAPARKRVLVVSVTKGHRHGSVPLGEEILRELGEKSGGWAVDFARTDEDLAQKMTPVGLKKCHAVVFNNTTGDLPIPDRRAFLDWIKAGGGFVGIHAATDTFHGWPEYIEMIGGEFVGHGPDSEVELLVEDRKHPATRSLPPKFKLTEEIYLFKNFSRDRVRGLIALDKRPNTGEPGDYPISWVRTYGKGRVFYTSLGHREDVWKNELAQKHILGGMRWALGLDPGGARPAPPPSPVTRTERRQGFRAIFNGRDTTGWHARYEGRTPWTVQNGMLVMGHGGADLITDEKFGDFILRYEYMIPKGGNSGVYLRGRYEIQILDDFGTKKPAVCGNGAIYGKIAPARFASRPPGEWQTVEARLVGNRVTVVLNGVRIIDDQPIEGLCRGAVDERVDDPGPIMLQGDHDPVAFRNIRVKALGEKRSDHP